MRIDSDWNHYDYTYGEGQHATTHFHVGSAVFSDPGLPHGARVIFAAPFEQDAFLAMVQDVDGRLVGRMEYAGKVEMVAALAEADGLEPARSAIEAAGGTIELTDGWGYFDSRVCPSAADWRRIEDREALERLDLDGDGELRILHRFFGGAEALERVWERLEPEGFASVERGDDRMTLAHRHPIADISRITVGLQRLCERAGIAYDGWVLPG
jgi:hypothetical protein